MTYSYTQDVPIDATFYKRVTDALGDEAPKGMILHLAMERPEGGLRYLDMWESQEDCDRFAEERLHPVIHGMLSEIFGDNMPPEPPRTPISVIHYWHQEDNS